MFPIWFFHGVPPDRYPSTPNTTAKKRKDESQNFVSCFQRGIFLLAVVWGVPAALSGGTP